MPEVESKKRVSIPVETISQIQQSCFEHDDDMRWLIALISDTGMLDRLGAISCPSEMIDQIGGWSTGKVGEGYGEGYSVGKLRGWMLTCRHHTPRKIYGW